MLRTLLTLLLAVFALAAQAAVDANQGNQAELETVKGVGPAIATRILDERKKSPFKDWADLMERVKGVGEGNATKFSANGLTVGGAAYKGTAPTAQAAKAPKK